MRRPFFCRGRLRTRPSDGPTRRTGAPNPHQKPERLLQTRFGRRRPAGTGGPSSPTCGLLLHPERAFERSSIPAATKTQRAALQVTLHACVFARAPVTRYHAILIPEPECGVRV